MEERHDALRGLHNIFDENPPKAKGACTMQNLDLTQPIEIVPTKTEKQPLKRIVIKFGPFMEMWSDFVKASPDESIVWLTGVVRNGIGIVEKYWGCELEYASPAGAKTKPKWLLNFIDRLRIFYPEHNLVIEAHRHPIGSTLSSIDKDAVRALNDWNQEWYWVMIACDFRLGSYTVRNDEICRITWEVDGKWVENKPSQTQTPYITFARYWARNVFKKLKALRLL